MFTGGESVIAKITKAKRQALEIALTKLNESQQWIEAEQKQAKLGSQRSRD